MDFDRLKHSLAVGRKMMEIGEKRGMPEGELRKLFVLGFNHDIGYEFGDRHEVDGAEVLEECGFCFSDEVRHHGDPDVKIPSGYLEILNMADMQIDSHGDDVGYEKRLEDIKSRYGENSEVYRKAGELTSMMAKKI